LLIFWASWCPPCKLLSPVLSKIAKEYQGKFLLVKVNVDENPELAEKYQIFSIPSVKMFKNGKIVDEFLGAIPESLIRRWLDKNLR
jgi:putative thioredoxin